MTGPRNEGGQWVGVIDLLLRRPDGHLVVLDHKAKPGQHEDVWREKGREHSGQLVTYQGLVDGNGAIAEGVVHLPIGGGVARLKR